MPYSDPADKRRWNRERKREERERLKFYDEQQYRQLFNGKTQGGGNADSKLVKMFLMFDAANENEAIMALRKFRLRLKQLKMTARDIKLMKR